MTAHNKLNLSEVIIDDEDHPHRPDLSVWNDDEEKKICVCIRALWGQPVRFIDMKPDEARRLATMLVEAAEKVE